MQQGTFFQQQDQTPPELGNLEGEYALDFKKMLALGIFGLAAALFASVIEQPIILPWLAGLPIPFSLAVFFCYCLLETGVWLAFFFFYRNWRMSLYTNGFIYRNRNKRRVIYWQQVTSVYRLRGGGFYIFVRDEWFIIVPSLISHYGALRARMTREAKISHY